MVPSLKFGELLTEPVIDPSAFCVHRLITGILSLGAALEAGLAAGFFPSMDIVGRAAGLADGLGAGFGAEKMDRVGRAAVFLGVGGDTDFGAAFGAEKMDRVGRPAAFLGAGVGAVLGAGAVLGFQRTKKASPWGPVPGWAWASVLEQELDLQRSLQPSQPPMLPPRTKFQL